MWIKGARGAAMLGYCLTTSKYCLTKCPTFCRSSNKLREPRSNPGMTQAPKLEPGGPTAHPRKFVQAGFDHRAYPTTSLPRNQNLPGWPRTLQTLWQTLLPSPNI